MVDWIRLNRFKERPLLCCFATPDRAFAQIRKMVRERTGQDVTRMENPIAYLDAGGEAQRKPEVTPLPFASLGRIGVGLDLTRYVRFYFRRRYYTADRTKYYGMKRPLPINLSYQVDLWARDLFDLDDLANQMLLRLEADYFYLTVEHPFPMGEKIVYTKFEGVVDKSDLEPAEQQRVLRKSFTFTVHGWLAYPADEYGIVETAGIEIDRSEDLEEIDEVLDVVEME